MPSSVSRQTKLQQLRQTPPTWFVQATEKALRTLVLQEHANWLNLASLSDRERDKVLDKPIVPEGIFSSVLACMERHSKTKKKQGKALQLFLPVRPMTHPQKVPWKVFRPAAPQTSPLRNPKWAKPEDPHELLVQDSVHLNRHEVCQKITLREGQVEAGSKCRQIGNSSLVPSACEYTRAHQTIWQVVAQSRREEGGSRSRPALVTGADWQMSCRCG